MVISYVVFAPRIQLRHHRQWRSRMYSIYALPSLVQVGRHPYRLNFSPSNEIPGMGGLATALSLAKKGFKQIDVYESASNLGFVGAGIQLAPNMARILDRLGVWKDIEAEAVDLKSTSIRRTSHYLLRVHAKLTARQRDRPTSS